MSFLVRTRFITWCPECTDSKMDMLLRAPELKWEGNLAENWRRFWQAFGFFVTASGHEAKGPKMKTSMLLTCLGERGQEIYKNFAFEDDLVGKEMDLETVKTKFEMYFNLKKNRAFESYTFNSCHF